jgi:hypothetical protein
MQRNGMGGGWMKYWGWMDYILVSSVIFAIGLVILMIIFSVSDSMESVKFIASCPGKSYQALVIELGTPSERETFSDGTEVVCWKKYHSQITTFVNTGKIITPIIHPAYISGWKAIMLEGRCISMDKL